MTKTTTTEERLARLQTVLQCYHDAFTPPTPEQYAEELRRQYRGGKDYKTALRKRQKEYGERLRALLAERCARQHD